MKKIFFATQMKDNGAGKKGETGTSAKRARGDGRAGILRSRSLKLTATLVALIVTLTFAGVVPALAEPKKTIVLVHGSWHGAWSWAKVTPYLQRSGHKVTALDLPGLGFDRTPHTKVSFKMGVDRLLEVLDQQSDPVVLVGHSGGGPFITQAAEYRPKKIDTLVYLTAFMTKNGQSQGDVSRQARDSLIGPALRPVGEKGTMLFNPDAARDALYADVSDADVKWAKSLLRAGNPLAYMGTPVQTSDKGYGSCRRVFIKTLQDRAIPLWLQEKMIKEHAVEEVYQIDSSHSPFLSKPEELAGILSSM
jgi:pimeloyl-ACP methyl ester carboxylesterase